MKLIADMLKHFAMTVLVMFIIWLGASYIDIIADNTKPNPHHYDWNFFVIATEIGEMRGGN